MLLEIARHSGKLVHQPNQPLLQALFWLGKTSRVEHRDEFRAGGEQMILVIKLLIVIAMDCREAGPRHQDGGYVIWYGLVE